MDLAPAGAPEGSASSADGTGVTGIAGGGGEQQNEAAGLGVESPDGDPSAKSEEGAAGLEAAPGTFYPPAALNSRSIRRSRRHVFLGMWTSVRVVFVVSAAHTYVNVGVSRA